MSKLIDFKTLEDYHVKQVAKTCHQVNRAYCQIIGDDSQPDWENAPAWQKESSFNTAKLLLDFPGTTSEDLHAHWVAEKEADGWTYHPSKNAEKKTHPCLLPYHMLPKKQRDKDVLLIAVVKSFTISTPKQNHNENN